MCSNQFGRCGECLDGGRVTSDEADISDQEKSDPDMADRERASHTNKVDDKQKHKQYKKTETQKQQLSDTLCFIHLCFNDLCPMLC